MTAHPEYYLHQTGRCDFGDGRGMVSYRLLFDGPSQREMIRRQDKIVSLLVELPQSLRQGFAQRLEGMTVQGYIAVPEFVREDETAGPTFNRIFRWTEVAELADFESALLAAVTEFRQGGFSTVGCDKATVGAPGRGVESRPGCGSRVQS